MMRTVILDILKDEAFDLLKDLEALKIIRIQDAGEIPKRAMVNLSAKYAGKMTRQSVDEINKQFNDLRKEWD